MPFITRIRSVQHNANMYDELRSHCKAADYYINARHNAKSAHRQWELIACGLDRLFMTSFILFTVFYFFWLFFTNMNSTTDITDEMMDNLTPIQ
uniref:Uncharacterized protein n=1 Tax=Panagrolaimus davidi TaxID=227884 RepID=A0A914Q5I0_9BILA